VAPEDCTGCTLCVEICPVKSKSEAKHKAINMEMQAPLREAEVKNWSFFSSAWRWIATAVHTQVKDINCSSRSLISRARARVGRDAYLKLWTRFRDRLLIAMPTGCSSIYGESPPRLLGEQGDAGLMVELAV